MVKSAIEQRKHRMETCLKRCRYP